jgi:sporulation protein YlmC with PRC-barrel domain
MTKTTIFILFIFVASLTIVLPINGMAQQSPPSSRMEHQHNSMQQSKADSFHANDFIGKNVKDSKGEELGKVEDVIIQNDGTASFVILSRGGTLGVGTKYYPVPFKTFMSSTNMAKMDWEKDVTANLDRSKLDSGPNFSDKESKELYGKGWQDKVCAHYGAECHFM